MILTHLVFFQFLGGASAGSTPIPPPVVVTPSGGYYDPPRKRKTKEDVRAERIRLGILKEPEAVKAVEAVAQTVIQARDSKLALKQTEQTELLQNMLVERGIVLKAVPRIEAVLRAVIKEEIERQDKEDMAIVQMLDNL